MKHLNPCLYQAMELIIPRKKKIGFTSRNINTDEKSLYNLLNDTILTITIMSIFSTKVSLLVIPDLTQRNESHHLFKFLVTTSQKNKIK